jgi:hypothetical protein
MRLLRISADDANAVSVSACAIGCRLMIRTSGRNVRLTRTTKLVASAACSGWPLPASSPTAAEHHNVAAVLRPVTCSPSRKMMPAPRKPIPETTCAATRVGLPSSGNRPSKTTKLAAPIATSVLVRKPAIRCRHWRSNPMMAPIKVATPRCQRPDRSMRSL